MFEKRRSRKNSSMVLLFALLLALSLLQGCNEPGDIEEISGVTVTTEISGKEAADVTPTVKASVTQGGEEDENQPESHRELPKFTLTVGNELYFEFAYEWDILAYRSENPDIVQAMFMEGEYDFEEGCETTGVMLYGIANGETELVVSDIISGQEVRWKVTVEKPETETGKQKLIDWLLANGETNDLGDKVLTKGIPESGGQATVEYATMDENINFYYTEQQGGEKIRWNLIPNPRENTEYYITMRMGEEFVTATVDLVTYDGETLAFEQGWFGIPAEEAVQPLANEASKRAYEEVKTLLYEKTGMTMGDIVK